MTAESSSYKQSFWYVPPDLRAVVCACIVIVLLVMQPDPAMNEFGGALLENKLPFVIIFGFGVVIACIEMYEEKRL